MRTLDLGGLPTSLGEILNFKYHLDLVKHNYDKIVISFHTDLWNQALNTTAHDWGHKKALWEKYLNDIGKLFFSEKPYEIRPAGRGQKFGGDITALMFNLKMTPQKPELANLLCKGTPLNFGKEYIVITTKTREFHRYNFDNIYIPFFNIMKQLSNKYKIVIIGERMVEMRKEYQRLRIRPFGIYYEIMANIPRENIIDFTVPALGETVSDLSKIQQDCLIMKQAKFVITFGVGGNFCLSTSVANMAIGYRTDDLKYTDDIFQFKEYPNAIITKNQERFLNALRYYL